jgi:hypothetical protein
VARWRRPTVRCCRRRKPITVKSVEVIEIEDNKIKVLRHYFDLMTMLQQIGAIDPPATALASRLHSAATDG